MTEALVFIKYTLVALLTLSPLPSLGAVTPSNIEGTWSCDPYTMKGKNITITVEERHKYEKGGMYSERGTSTITVLDGRTVTTESSLSGSWLLSNGIIELEFTSGKFLSSSSQNYTIQMGQDALDAELKKKNWSKMRVLEFHKRLVTTAVDPMYKEAQVLVSCNRS